MNQKNFLQIVSTIFLVIAVLHLLRIWYGWDAMIGGWAIPTWLSGIALVVSAVLSYKGFTLGKKF